MVMMDWRLLMAGVSTGDQNAQNHQNTEESKVISSGYQRNKYALFDGSEGQMVQWKSAGNSLNRGIVLLSDGGWILVRTIQDECPRFVFISAKVLQRCHE
jgi:hypothetical protein